ncbi:MAG: AAA family ATPase [Candidatus Lokiarchaeota archaeon]|nr:AAA family ATPase [Candidatus Lokiarchaeota archaeon]
MQPIKATRLDGYRALFDPHYIPPTLVGRQREAAFLKGFLTDSIVTRFGTNTREASGMAIMVNGLKGVGKATLVRKVVGEMQDEHRSQVPVQMQGISINCQEKDEPQLLGDLIAKLNIPLDVPAGSPVDIPGTWNTISSVLRKRATSTAYTIFFNNVECVPLRFFNKLALNLKHQGMNLLMATSMRHNNYFIENLDLSLDLDVYRVGELLDIVDQRANCAFSGLDQRVSQFITDAVVAFDSPRPGPCMNVMRHMYPHIMDGNADDVPLELIQNSIKNALPEISYNELEIAEFFADAAIQKVIFLDNIVGQVEASGQFYLSRADLRSIYHATCESLDMEPEMAEFNTFMADLMACNIFLKSNHQPECFFTMIPAQLIKGYIDATIK